LDIDFKDLHNRILEYAQFRKSLNLIFCSCLTNTV